MLRLGVNTAMMRRRNEQMLDRRAAARARALRDMLNPAVGELLSASPEDTGRYKRGWGQAGNQAGLGPFLIAPVRESRFSDVWEARLKAQVQKWRSIANAKKGKWLFWQKMLTTRYDAKGRRGKWRNDCLKKVRNADSEYLKALKLLTRAEEELAKFLGARQQAVVIFGGKGRKLKITVRPTVYGGFGRMYAEADRAVCILHNREPHASIVESRNKGLAAVTARLKGRGVARLRKSYADGIFRAAAPAGGGVPMGVALAEGVGPTSTAIVKR